MCRVCLAGRGGKSQPYCRYSSSAEGQSAPAEQVDARAILARGAGLRYPTAVQRVATRRRPPPPSPGRRGRRTTRATPDGTHTAPGHPRARDPGRPRHGEHRAARPGGRGGAAAAGGDPQRRHGAAAQGGTVRTTRSLAAKRASSSSRQRRCRRIGPPSTSSGRPAASSGTRRRHRCWGAVSCVGPVGDALPGERLVGEPHRRAPPVAPDDGLVTRYSCFVVAAPVPEPHAPRPVAAAPASRYAARPVSATLLAQRRSCSATS